MLRIELNRLGDQIKTDITIEGAKSDVLPEVLHFHEDHFNMMRGITDRLPSDLKIGVLIGLVEHLKECTEGSDND